jgi:CelD/BcsL family acetyltransferase involved in cellulose biosynthesis
VPSIAAAPGGPLTVELRRDLDLPPQDASALDALIDGRPQIGVFLSKAWLSGLFAEPPDGVEPSLAIVREGSTLRAVAPIAVRRALTHVRVGLLGGAAGSDRVDVLAAPGFDVACADALLRWLGDAFGRRSFVLELRDVPADSPLYGAVRRRSAEQTLPLVLQPREIHVHPYLDLRQPRPRAGAPPARNSRSLDKHRRWLERRGAFAIEMLEHPGDVLEAFEALTRFLHARWHNRGPRRAFSSALGWNGADGSALDNSRALRFHRRALPLLLSEGRLRMIRLSADSRTIAVFYGLASAGWWGYYLAGYDREWAGRIHLGQITLATAIDLAVQEGSDEFDFLKGAEPVKYLWPVRERATLDSDVYSAACGAQLERGARAIRDAAAAFAKSARSLLRES